VSTVCGSFFFFQAEDGIRDGHVTGVQTCALPIFSSTKGARSVRGQLSGTTPEPFVLESQDWFALPGPERLAWPQIHAAVEEEQTKLAALVAELAAGRTLSRLSEAERFNLVLGITCHAVYHAGQIQLLKRLHGA